MRSFYLHFLNRLVWFTLITTAVILGLAYLAVPHPYRSVALPFLFPFFFSVTLIVHFILSKAYEKRPAVFVSRFMLTSFLKLIFYVAVLTVYLLLNRDDAIPFSVPYLLLYVLFTAFEVISFLGYARKSVPRQERKNESFTN
jgi:hypothetical protein